jgi:hypothetical protein
LSGIVTKKILLANKIDMLDEVKQGDVFNLQKPAFTTA